MEYIHNLLNGMLSGSVNSISSAIIYVAIVLLFIIGLIRCIAPVMGTRGTLKRAIRSIRSQGDKKYAWQEDTFLGKGTLYAHWSQYLNNLFFADGVYHNASNVEDYINEETVIYGPGRVSFSEALPGLMTSLGFLGTLIGLARGLSGFSMTDSAAVQQSIVTLIPGMRYAFLTSIFGVVGSVLFTLITRMVYGSTEHTLKAFYSAMSRHAGVLSVDPMTQVAIYQQEQTALIQTMAKDLNGKFTENIADAVHSAIEPLNQSLRSFMSVASKDQMRFMDAVMQRFADRLDESVQGQLKRFGQVLDETSRLQNENCVVVRASLAGTKEVAADLQEMQGIAQDMLRSLSDYVAQLNENRAQVDDGFLRMSSSIEQMELVSRQQNNYLKTVSAMQADVARSVETMTQAVNDFTKRFADQNASASDAMQRASKNLSEAAGRIESVHMQAKRSLEEELSTTLDSYRDYVNQFTKRVDYLSSNISGALAQMPDAVSEANNRFLDQVDRLTATLNQAQRGLDDAVNRLYRGR